MKKKIFDYIELGILILAFICCFIKKKSKFDSYSCIIRKIFVFLSNFYKLRINKIQLNFVTLKKISILVSELRYIVVFK